ncbi:MAG: multicopper oxidase domain-containing protein, partial [Mesorhizobium sp.]
MSILTRRTLLKASAAAAGGFGLGAMGNMVGAALAVPDPEILRTAKTTARLTEAGPTRNVLTYGDAGMPPVLRMTKGKPFGARLVNGLDEPTTIHWHGMRVPN